MELLDLLVNGKVEEFNAKRSRRGTLDLFGADLAGARLPGVDLSGTNLEKADLSGADLTDAIFARSNLSGADLTGATLVGVMAIKSVWREAFMGSVDMHDSDFTGADLSDAEITGANLSNIVMGGAKAKRTDFSGSNLSGGDFAEARFSNAKLGGCNLSNAILREASLVSAELSSASLVEADLTRAKLNHAVLSEADLTKARLPGADLTSANLTNARVTGADLTRADLSEAVLSGVRLQEAVTLEAVVDSGVLGPSAAESEPPEAILIEEPIIAVGAARAAVLWDNPEGEDKNAIRVAVGPLGRTYAGNPVLLPVPADLVIARAMVAVGDGFGVLLLVTGNWFLLGPDGAIRASRRLKIPYTPAARPILKSTDAGVVLYGISREGPGLHVHRIDAEALTPLHGSAMPTLRGFVSDHHPIVLSKGGVVVELGPKGPASPLRTPANFPGRRCGACPTTEGMSVGWLTTAPGIFFARVSAKGVSDEVHLLKKNAIGLLDLGSAAGRGFAAFTKSPRREVDASSAWAMRLPEGEPYALVDDPDRDVTEVKIVPSGDVCYCAVADSEGGVELFELGDSAAVSRWRIGSTV
jgi:uncharacterized protein YjbI with pentapeptide repeats